jgi:hypothetical protein
MSIDFNVGIAREFTVEALVNQVRRRLHELTGGSDSGMTAVVWLSPSDYSSGALGLTDGFEAVMCGPRHPDRWIRLSRAPEALVDISVVSSEGPTGNVDLEATAEWRTPSSVVVAIAAVIAGADVGGGEFDANVDRILGERVASPQGLTDRLRLRTHVQLDFEAASRELLNATPGFPDWAT